MLKDTFFFSTKKKKENSNNKTNLKNRLEDEVESFSGFFTYNTTNIATDRMMAESETDQQTQQRPTKRKTQRPTRNTVKNILFFLHWGWCDRRCCYCCFLWFKHLNVIWTYICSSFVRSLARSFHHHTYTTHFLMFLRCCRHCGSCQCCQTEGKC